MTFLVSAFICLIPFSYASITGIRVLFFQAILGLCIIFYNFAFKKMRFCFSLIGFFLSAMFFIVFCYALFTGYVNELLSFIVFFVILYAVSSSVRGGYLDAYMFNTLYVAGAIFTAVGIFVQYGLHRLYGLELFNYQQFGGGRNAYGFIWADYSFLSLYLISAVPLLFRRFSFLVAIALMLLVVLASILTSARTGFAALLLFLVLVVVVFILKGLVVGKINRYVLALVISAFMSPFFFIYGLEALTGRALSISSSGRFEDFITGWSFFSENPFFGSLLNKDFYYNSVATIPHNIFIYMLYMGGLVLFAIFMGWLLSNACLVARGDRGIAYSLLIVFLGFQFIPSFFSAYFVAVLLGFALSEAKVRDFSSTLN